MSISTELAQIEAAAAKLQNPKGYKDLLSLQRDGANLRHHLLALEQNLESELCLENPLAAQRIHEWLPLRQTYFCTLQKASEHLEKCQEDQEDFLEIAGLDPINFQIPKEATALPQETAKAPTPTPPEAVKESRSSPLGAIKPASVASTSLEENFPVDLSALQEYLDDLDGCLNKDLEAYKASMSERSIRCLVKITSLQENLAAHIEEVMGKLEDPTSAKANRVRLTLHNFLDSVALADAVLAKQPPNPLEAICEDPVSNRTQNWLDQSAAPVKPPVSVESMKPAATCSPSIVSVHEDPMRTWFLGEATLKAIPDFSGAFDEYPAWRKAASLYIALPSLLEETKLNNLKAKLGEKVKRLVRTVNVLTPQPVKTLLKILDQEYGDIRMIIRDQRVKLRNLSKPKSESYDQKRDFILAISQAVNCLVATGYKIQEDEDLFDSVIGKGPRPWAQSFLDHYPPEEQHLPNLVIWMEKKLLSSKHKQQKCPVDPSCTYPHHELLHGTKPKGTSGPTAERSQPAQQPAENAAAAAEPEQAVIACSAFSQLCPDATVQSHAEREEALPHSLRLIKVFIRPKGAENYPHLKVTALIDPGCNWSLLVVQLIPAVPTLTMNYSMGPSLREPQDPLLKGANLPNSLLKMLLLLLNQNRLSLLALPLANCVLMQLPKGAENYPHLKVTALIDPGCNWSLLEERLAEKMGLKIHYDDLSTSTVGGTSKQKGGQIQLDISRDGLEWLSPAAVRTQRNLKLPGPAIKWSEFVSRNPDFQQVNVEDVDFKDIKLFLGADMEWHPGIQNQAGLDHWSDIKLFLGADMEVNTLPIESMDNWVKDDSGVLAFKTKLGWTIGGPLLAAEQFVHSYSTIVSEEAEVSLAAELPAKSRVINKNKAPTTPRGELQGLVVATRMARTIVAELKSCTTINLLVFWIDSHIVYCWVRNDRNRYQEFVANRLGEIHDTLEDLKHLQPSVRWVSTKSNPADLISRGTDAATLADQFKFWSEGPEFLSKSEVEWPEQPKHQEKRDDPELKRIFLNLAAVTYPGVEEASNIRQYYVQKTGKLEPNPQELLAAEEELVLLRVFLRKLFLIRRHKIYAFDEVWLDHDCLNACVVVQHPYNFIVTTQRGPHGGFNTGLNLNVAVNFANQLWVDYGLRVKFRSCQGAEENNVRFPLEPFVRHYCSPAIYEEWLRHGLQKFPANRPDLSATEIPQQVPPPTISQLKLTRIPQTDDEWEYKIRGDKVQKQLLILFQKRIAFLEGKVDDYLGVGQAVIFEDLIPIFEAEIEILRLWWILRSQNGACPGTPIA
ncbi:unnamed protein product [Notodromas monacha]|uniref:Uncharacterized protein n=1 Tax=Notodromas monacha TaxID=399045 RepID=A0A7R9BJC7_9CRUS|nr:unnamed protein product [Notodromas monacha]CAG0915468.1 unnamed protein product [Notodromas monacha]